ncbi:MAG: hypothetical protein ACK4SF_08730 [Algoriphagus aquaeductus]|uniref:hypothetical protein n=1 Tax=Algoriphagus aquaeductus TaxID=475299 RepID=UPI00391DBCF8
MTFQEIDLTFDLIGTGIPIEIKVIYGYEFYENELLNRFQKLSGENHLSFTPYGDYWRFIDDWKGDKVFGENGEIIENIVPYYEAYSKGFLDGYFEFENEIKELNQIFNQNSFSIDKIFDEIKSSTSPFSSRGYHCPNDDSKQKPIPILDKSLLSKGGKKIGRNYKAWFYILKNPKPFVSLFRSFYFETFKFYEDEIRKWNSHIEGYISPLQTVIDEIQNECSDTSFISTATKNKTEQRSLIINSEIRTSLFDGLKQYFVDKESELENLLSSKKIPDKLVWPLNQNQLADLFLRLSYNGFIKNNKTQIKSWLAENFTLSSGQINESSVYDILKRKSEINKDKRILEDLAPFKPKSK